MSCLKGLTDATIKSKMTHSLPSDGSGQLPSYRKLCTNVKYYNCTCVRPLRSWQKRLSTFEGAFSPTEAPKTKKRKKSSKQELLSPLETGTAPILPPPPPPPLVSKSFVPDKKTDGSKKSSLSGLVEPEDSQVASQSSSHTDATASKTLEPAKKRTIKRNYLKPHNGCELHKKSIAAVASSFTLCQLQAAISCYSIKQTNKFFDYLFLTSFSLDDTHGLDGGAQVCHTSGCTVH